MATNPLSNLSIQQLKQAITIKQRIDALQKQLDQIAGSQATVLAATTTVKRKTMSVAVRAKLHPIQNHSIHHSKCYMDADGSGAVSPWLR